MPFIMPYTDKTGRTSEQSFWFLQTINLDVVRKTWKILFYGWNSAEDFDLKRQPIGQKQYEINPQNFDAALSEVQQELGTLLQACHALAKMTKDVGDPPQEDETEDKRISFFETAMEV